MASLTNTEVVPAKSELAVVARHTALPPPGGMVIERLRLCNLPALRHSRADLVTFVAVKRAMFRMIKAHAKGLC